MKIRTDFVTNSSSSSFCVNLIVEDIDRRVYVLKDIPTEYNVDCGGTAVFDANLENAAKCADVAELCEFLTAAVKDDYRGEENDDPENHINVMKARKAEFTEQLIKNVSDLSEIKTIRVIRKYDAWGEYADLIADNDYELCDLAQAYLDAEGEEKESAKEAFLKYIDTPDEERVGDYFGHGYEDIRYVLEDDIDEVAERLCSGFAPENVSGNECQYLDMKTGKVVRYAEFILK